MPSSQALAEIGSGWPPHSFELAYRRGFVHFEAQRALGYRTRQYLQRNVDQHSERAERARENARHVVTGDVLHHAPAKRKHVAAAVDDARAENEVTYRSCRDTTWAGDAGGDGTADGGRRAEVRRFERQHLIVLGERRFELDQCRAGPDGDDEFGRRVIDDAAVFARIEWLA